jgi:hypothetical protein
MRVDVAVVMIPRRWPHVFVRTIPNLSFRKWRLLQGSRWRSRFQAIFSFEKRRRW